MPFFFLSFSFSFCQVLPFFVVLGSKGAQLVPLGQIQLLEVVILIRERHEIERAWVQALANR